MDTEEENYECVKVIDNIEQKTEVSIIADVTTNSFPEYIEKNQSSSKDLLEKINKSDNKINVDEVINNECKENDGDDKIDLKAEQNKKIVNETTNENSDTSQDTNITYDTVLPDSGPPD